MRYFNDNQVFEQGEIADRIIDPAITIDTHVTVLRKIERDIQSEFRNISLKEFKKFVFNQLDSVSFQITESQFNPLFKHTPLKSWSHLVNLSSILEKIHLEYGDGICHPTTGKRLVRVTKQYIQEKILLRKLKDSKLVPIRMLDNSVRLLKTEDERISKSPKKYSENIREAVISFVPEGRKQLLSNPGGGFFDKIIEDNETNFLANLVFSRGMNHEKWLGWRMWSTMQEQGVPYLGDQLREFKEVFHFLLKGINTLFSTLPKVQKMNVKTLVAPAFTSIGLPNEDIRKFINLLKKSGILWEDSSQLQLSLASLGVLRAILDYFTNTTRYLNFIGQSFENQLIELSKPFDVESISRLSKTSGKELLDVLIIGRDTALIIECKFISDPPLRKLIQEIEKFQYSLDSIRKKEDELSLRGKHLIPIFYSPVVPWPKYKDILLIDSTSFILELFFILFDRKKSSGPPPQEFATAQKIFHDNDYDHCIDLVTLHNDIPPDLFRIDYVFVLEKDPDYSEVSVIPNSFPTHIILDIPENIREDFFDEVSNGEYIQVLLFNVHQTKTWSETQIVDFKT